MNEIGQDREAIPDAWREDAAGLFEENEHVIGWFEPDLDSTFRFRSSLVVLTDRRLIHLDRESHSETRSWPLAEVVRLSVKERNDLGSFEVMGPTGRLALLPYSPRQSRAAHTLSKLFTESKLAGAMPVMAGGVPLNARSQTLASTHQPYLIFRLWRFARPHAWALLLGIMLTLAATVANLIPPYLTIPLADNILVPYQSQVQAVQDQKGLDPAILEAKLAEVRQSNQHRFRSVPWLLTGFAAAALAAWVFSWAQGYVIAWVGEQIAADLRNETYSHLHLLSLEFFGGKRTGDLIARISNDTDRICSFLSDSLLDFITDCLFLVGTAVILLVIDPVLALATMVLAPLNVWLVYRVRERLRHGFSRGSRAWSEMTNILADTLPGIRVVKAFAQERREVGKFRQSNDRIVQANMRVNTVWTFFWPLVAFLNQAGLLIVWAVGAWRVYEQRITYGVLGAFILYITRFYTRIEAMSRIVSATQRAATSTGRLFELLDRKPSVPDPADPVPLSRVEGAIELRDVGFRYGHRRVLQDINLSIRPGEMIGLVGPSGAGKSTVVNLLCRFYDVTEGSILVDGVDIRRLAVQQYRKQIGLVLQEPFLFFGTIAENIAYGHPEASRAEIIAAARAAKAHDFIVRLPDGYDTHVGERGQSLSGGERQRISIARALLIDPAILILDEATSSVDTETEREIQEALDYLVQGRTTIAIAHRLSTLRKADRLVVLEAGRVAEVGQHQELLLRNGTYARLHEAQFELAQGLAASS